MNIFYLHKDPRQCAQMHCDKHVVKMIVEYAQLMSTAHRVLDGELYNGKTKNGRNIKRYRLNDKREDILYKASHINHPQNIWVRQSSAHYRWLYQMWVNLCEEYTYRYGKVHSTYSKLGLTLRITPNKILHNNFLTPPKTMPDDVKVICSVDSYRNFYKVHKAGFSKWTKRSIPEWML